MNQADRPKNPARPAPSKETDGLLRLLREIQKIDPEFPLQYAICMAEISKDEGLSLTSLAERTGLALSTVSRIVGALSEYRQKGAPYGLVKIKISARERRKKEISLTTKGKAVMRGIAEVIGSMRHAA